jgi:hypothetical protein
MLSNTEFVIFFVTRGSSLHTVVSVFYFSYSYFYLQLVISEFIYINCFYEWVSNYILFLCHNDTLHIYYAVIESLYYLLFRQQSFRIWEWCFGTWEHMLPLFWNACYKYFEISKKLKRKIRMYISTCCTLTKSFHEKSICHVAYVCKKDKFNGKK